MSKLAVSRDFSRELLLLLETADGREKIARLFFFFAKYLRWKESKEKQREDYLVFYSNVENSMALIQSFLAFGRTFVLIKQIHQLLLSKNQSIAIDGHQSHRLEVLLQVIAKLFFISCTSLDHMGFLQRLGFWKPKLEISQKLGYYTNSSWLGGLIFSTLDTLLKLYQLSNASLVHGNGTTTTTTTAITSTPELLITTSISNSPMLLTEEVVQATRRETLGSLIRNSLDIPIALHFLGRTGDHPEGHFGILGVITSLLGLYEVWPEVILPLKVKMA